MEFRMPFLHISLYHFILDDALDNAEARVGIYYCLYPKCWYWYSITDADNILGLGDKTVVGALQLVIELCSCEEASVCSADIDRSTTVRGGAMWKVSWVHLGSRYKAAYNKNSFFPLPSLESSRSIYVAPCLVQFVFSISSILSTAKVQSFIMMILQHNHFSATIFLARNKMMMSHNTITLRWHYLFHRKTIFSVG